MTPGYALALLRSEMREIADLRFQSSKKKEKQNHTDR
jgi:hypothetical protein